MQSFVRKGGGLAGAGLQMGAGLELSKILADDKNEHFNALTSDPVQKMQQLKVLLNEGIITQEEFDDKRKPGWINYK